MNGIPLFQQCGNSLIYALGTAAFTTFIAVPTGYALARWNSFCMKTLFWCCVLLLFLPFQVTMLPQYILLDRANLLNTYGAILVPGMVSPLPILILWMGHRRIPIEYEEAFRLESNSLFIYFFYILLPNLAEVIVAAFAICFFLNWNLVDPALIFLENRKLWPLSLGLWELEGSQRLLYGVIDMLPVLLMLGATYAFTREKMSKFFSFHY